MFNAYSAYYDLLYADKPYEDEVGYIMSQLKRLGIQKGTLLEFGSGTGRHGRLLGELGYSVLGVEQSASMLAKSVDTGSFHAIQGDLLDASLKREFDAILALFHVFSYQVSEDASVKFFQQANRHLKPQGVLLFDCWYTPAVFSTGCSVRVKEIQSETIKVTRVAEPLSFPNEHRVDVKYTIFITHLESGIVECFTEIHSMRHFSSPEIRYLAKANGFDILNSEEFYTGRELSAETWGACFTLKKERGL